jgi:hypothetical protein
VREALLHHREDEAILDKLVLFEILVALLHDVETLYYKLLSLLLSLREEIEPIHHCRCIRSIHWVHLKLIFLLLNSML